MNNIVYNTVVVGREVLTYHFSSLDQLVNLLPQCPKFRAEMKERQDGKEAKSWLDTSISFHFDNVDSIKVRGTQYPNNSDILSFDLGLIYVTPIQLDRLHFSEQTELTIRDSSDGFNLVP